MKAICPFLTDPAKYRHLRFEPCIAHHFSNPSFRHRKLINASTTGFSAPKARGPKKFRKTQNFVTHCHSKLAGFADSETLENLLRHRSRLTHPPGAKKLSHVNGLNACAPLAPSSAIDFAGTRSTTGHYPYFVKPGSIHWHSRPGGSRENNRFAGTRVGFTINRRSPVPLRQRPQKSFEKTDSHTP